MQKAFIHIGTEKTGTTSLQEFFAGNREGFGKQNFYYPDTPGDTNHQKLAIYCAPENTRDLRPFFGLAADDKLSHFQNRFPVNLKNEIDKHRSSSILFSNEHLSSRIQNKQQIFKLQELMKYLNLDPVIIIYLRRQDQMMLSSYSTAIKSGSTRPFEIDLNPKRYNYYDILNDWAFVFGKDKIKVKRYHRKHWKNGNLMEDFLESLNINSFDGFGQSDRKPNKSLDRHLIKYLSVFNEQIPTIKDNKYNHDRGNILSVLESLSSDEKINLSSSSVLSILENFKEQNKKVAANYFNPPLSQLFEEPKMDDSVDQLPELTVEKSIEIGAKLWASKQRELNERNQ